MTEINYSSLKSVDFGELLEILNEKSLRRHLIDHPYFDRKSLAEWVESKTNIDKKALCLKAIRIHPAGMCASSRIRSSKARSWTGGSAFTNAITPMPCTVRTGGCAAPNGSVRTTAKA